MPNHEDYLIELLKDKYDHELRRKADLESSLNIPISILTVLFAGLFVVISDDNLQSNNNLLITTKNIFELLLFISCSLTLCLLIGVYYGWRRSYCAFPESKIVYEEDYIKLKKHHEEHNADNFEQSMIESLKRNVINWYLECNNNNTPVNDRRSNRFHRAKLALCISLMLGLTLLVTVTLIKYNNMSKQPPPPPPRPSPVRHERADKPSVTIPNLPKPSKTK